MSNDPWKRGEELLLHWFGDREDGWTVTPDRTALWFGKSDDADEDLRRRFGELAALAQRGGLAEWRHDPRSALALLLLLDQLSRNLYRGTPAAFASDPQALAVANELMQRGDDRKLRPIERPFVYLPLEHAEDRDQQRRSVDAFRALAAEAPPEARPAFDNFLDFALRHQAVIERFGRFPHRNRILGRASTPEEEAFLLEPGSSF